MSSHIEDGGPAFPCHSEKNWGATQWGMSLRDYFAGQALVGLLANPNYDNPRDIDVGNAYLYADYMLAARAAQGGDDA